jgi:hypothetical protein
MRGAEQETAAVSLIAINAATVVIALSSTARPGEASAGCHR